MSQPFNQQPHGQQPYNVPPAPVKKSKKWPWVVGIIAVFIVIAAVSGGEKEKASTDAATAGSVGAVDTQVEAGAVEASGRPGLNTPVRDGKFEFVVTEVQTGLSEVGDNPYLQRKAQGQFVIVTMTVQNISDKPKSLSPSNQELYDAQGRKFSADTMAAINLDSDVAVWDEINPGNTVTMHVVYDMPADAVPAEIALHDSMLSGGVRVALG